MAERITEAFLRDIEGSIGVPPLAPNSVIAGPLQIMIAEVRRLRGLIAPWARRGPSDDGEDCMFCGLTPSQHAASCPWPVLEAEAKAIAEEGK
jgi:hypothetical protein